MTSEHYNQDRDWREYLISTVIGEGNIVDSFVVDKGHRNGPEIHSVTDTGIIIIYNKKIRKDGNKINSKAWTSHPILQKRRKRDSMGNC